MADATAAFRSAFDQTMFFLTESIDAGGITRHGTRYVL